MKVLYITNGFWGSGEANMVQSHNTVAALVSQTGVTQVTFLAHAVERPSSSQLKQEFTQTTGVSPGDHLMMETALINPKSWWKTLLAVYKKLRDLEYGNYDLIYTRSREALVLFYLLGFKRFQYEAHNLEYPGSRYKRWLYRRAICYGKMQIATINKALIEDFKAIYGVNQARLSLNTCSARSQMQASPKISQRRYICYCGSSYPGKGFDEFVAFCRSHPELEFLAMVRSSTYLDEILADPPQNLKVMLNCNNAEVYQYLANSYIAVAPYSQNATTSGGSKNARYLSPLKVFEYMSAGCLVVAPNISAITEILHDKRDGFLYYLERGETLADGVRAALDAVADGLAQQVSDRARECFENAYSYDARAKKILSHSAASANKQRAIYLINSFNSGGAERGVLSLLDSGFFDGVQLDLVAIHRGSGPLLDEIKQRGFDCNIHICSGSQRLTVVSMARAFIYVLFSLLKHKYKFVMLSLIQANLIGLIITALYPRARVITFAHNTRFSKKIYFHLLKGLSRRIDVCLYDDEETQNAYRRILAEKESRLWVYAPLHFVGETAERAPRLNASPLKILCVGRLNKQKNYLQAIESISLLLKKGIEVELHIAGEGEQRAEIEAKVNQLGLGNNVKLLGYVSDWMAIGKTMDVYLLASTHEGMSISTIEAMSLGLAVVASNVGGIKSYGVDRHNMLRIENPVAEEFAAGIEALYNDRQLLAALGQQARADCIAKFGTEKVHEIICRANQLVFNPRVHVQT
ncbi:MAG: glycosyltransferase family 4 protein [Cellvibrionaceae bacterium]|nr:glycosyltransferase family 4 protein [Cellvibrionaceae bacterium]